MSPHELQTRELLLRLDRTRGGRLGRQLEEQLRDAIRSGVLAPGSNLPSTRMLAEDLDVSRGVVVRAYAQLAAEGYIRLRQGANPSVCRLPQPAPGVSTRTARTGGQKIRYDLRPHLPEVATFPRQGWVRATRNALARATNADLSYLDRRGLPALRAEVADYLRRARGVAADPRCIVITTGSTHSVSLICRVLAGLGSTRMAIENPSHFLLQNVATRAGQRPVPIPLDAHGLVVERLGDAQSVLVSPAHQFPTGVALSADRRSELVSWARSKDGLIVEDDYDAEFRYDRSPIGAMQGLAPDHVAYLGSTGKTLAPAIRVAWAVLPPSILDRVADELLETVLHVSGIDQLAFADFLARGDYDRHLRRMRALYRSRRDVLVDALAEYLPDLRVTGAAAGLHVVLELPSRELESSVRRLARSRGVLVDSLSQHALPGYQGPAGLLIGYGAVAAPAIPLAVEQIADAVRVSASASRELRAVA
jgi:GntR family transcriptional regulator/MocR family aminotransferase